MKVLFSVLVFGSLSLMASTQLKADFNDCNGLYVDQVIVDSSVGLRYVRFKESASGPGGALLTFNSWSEAHKNQVLGVLMMAKAKGSRLDVSKNGTCNSMSDLLGVTFKD